MDARIACAAWIASPILAGCAAQPAIDVGRLAPPQESARELAARSQEKLALGRSYLAAGEGKLGRFLLEQAKVDSELASMRSATQRLRAQGPQRVAAGLSP